MRVRLKTILFIINKFFYKIKQKILTKIKNGSNILIIKMKGGIIIKTSQEWLLLDKILEDGIIVDNNRYIKIIKIYPINYELKSELEKEAILNSYKLFLKVCDFEIQILVQSRKENLDSYISKMKDQINEEKNSKIINISNMFIDYIKNKNKYKVSSSKNFYILINSQIENNENEFNIKRIREDLNNKYFKIKDALSRCGNIVIDLSSRKEVEKVIFSFYNFRKSLKFI